MKINKFEFESEPPLDPLIRIIFLSLVSADGETCILNFEECSGFFCGEGGCVVRMFISGISLILM